MLNFESHTKPEKIVGVVWLVTQVVSFGFLVSSWCFASDLRKASDAVVPETSAGPTVSFDVVWTSLMVLATSLVSGMVLPLWSRKYTTPVNYGVMMGAIATMTSVALLTAVRYGHPSTAYRGVTHWPSANATAAFAALLFLSQIAFLLFAWVYKAAILKELPQAGDSLPHSQPQPVQP